MTFLAKLGQLIAKGIAIISGASPLISLVLGSGPNGQKAAGIEQTVAQDLTQIGSVVVTAESLLQGQAGTAKLAAATPLVASIVKTSELVSGHQIANETLFTQGCTKITSGVADILNALSDKNVSGSGTPIVVSPASVATANAAVQSSAPAAATSSATDGSDARPVPAIETVTT